MTIDSGCIDPESRDAMPLDWLKHAFAVEAAEGWSPTDDEQLVVDKLCRIVVERELTTPALVFLESVRPLNFLAAQTLQFFMPLLSSLGDARHCEVFAEFLEHRGAIDVLCQGIERHEREIKSS